MSDNRTSIRTRYIRLTLLLGFMGISYVFYTYLQLSTQSTEASNELTQIDVELATINDAHSGIESLYRSMELFLLETQKEEHYSGLVNSYTSVKTSLEKTYFRAKLINSSAVREMFNSLYEPLTTLQEVGKDPNKKYPGLALSANSMSIYQDLMKTRLKLMQDEIQNGDFIPHHQTLLSDLFEARILLEKEISQARIYLANRLALFSNTIIKNQVKSLSEIHTAFLEKILHLENLYKGESGSFEGLSNIKAIHDAQIKWYVDFEQLHNVSNTDYWRMDSYLVTNEIAPLMNKITSTLDQQNLALQQQKNYVHDRFKTSNQQLFYILVFLIIAFLIYIIILLVSMNWMLFTPLANIADVMLQKARGKETADFSETQSQETQQIVSSFKELETQVQLRTSELETAIKEAIQAEAEAQKANQAKSVFLANISHELRTPLHGILSFAELGLERADNLDPIHAKRYFDAIEQSGERLLALVNNLLDLEQLEAERFELELQQHNVIDTIKQVISRLEPDLIQKQLQLTLENQKQQQLATYDEKKISQVIQNLLVNSIRFTPTNGNIIIKAETLPDQQAIRVTIKDSGVGIPDDELESVFDKFVQSSKTATGAGGTGLGLAISQEIIRAHQGTIRAIQPETSGACIWFTLPVHQLAV